jgi:hypothetical protein
MNAIQISFNFKIRLCRRFFRFFLYVYEKERVHSSELLFYLSNKRTRTNVKKVHLKCQFQVLTKKANISMKNVRLILCV